MSKKKRKKRESEVAQEVLDTQYFPKNSPEEKKGQKKSKKKDEKPKDEDVKSQPSRSPNTTKQKKNSRLSFTLLINLGISIASVVFLLFGASWFYEKVSSFQWPSFSPSSITSRLNNQTVDEFPDELQGQPQEIVDALQGRSELGQLIESNELEGFFIDLQTIGEGDQDEDMRSFLIRALGLIEQKGDDFVFDLVYSTDEYPHQFDYSRKYQANYYVLVSPGLVKAGVFDYRGVRMSVRPVSNSLYSYMSDVKYCEVNSDCDIRGHFCTYGAFNKFQPYIEGWSCVGAPITEDEYEFGRYDPRLQCETQLEFARAECRQNRCIGLDKQIVCRRF